MLKAFHSKGLTEAGCDEAGRGCLAGPVIASAVILPTNFRHKLLNDSKQLTDKQRQILEPIIKEKALSWAIGVVSPQEIDEINILNASFLAMHRAIDKLERNVDLLLIDGNRFKTYKDIKHLCVVKGDSKFASIAAASVLAKNFRDELMLDLDSNFPQYDWKNNKGYPTVKHREAIRQIGACKHHRKSYQLLPAQIKLEF
jgi:ribonuclease HII